MRIFVSGSLRNIEKHPELCEKFVEKLGEAIMREKHILLTGCSGSLDKKIAESAANYLNDEIKCKNQIISYLVEDQEDEPAHNIGTIITSDLKNWNMEEEEAKLPEQISQADVTIFIAGSKGTFKGSNIATFAQKPILGIGMFGGAGKRINRRERNNFELRYKHLLNPPITYDDLNQVVSNPDNFEEFADKIITICECIMRSKKVFCIMSFDESYDNVYKSYEEVCQNNKLQAVRTDRTTELESITKRILEGIEQSDFVIADVSSMSQNVFYEVGYAKGLKRPVIITAKKGTDIPFDIKDFPIIFYENLDSNHLKQYLEPKLEEYIKYQINQL
jgi:hypothetical protein